MSAKGKEELRDLHFLLSAAAAWALCACIAVCIATVVANAVGLGEQGIGYLSSALSFLCAIVAGYAAARRRRASSFFTSLICATALIIVLLTVGFLIEGEGMDPSSILSLVSFTYAGVLLGATVLYRPEKNRKRGLALRN